MRPCQGRDRSSILLRRTKKKLAMSHSKENRIDASKIPAYVTHVTQTLEKAGFQAYIVGGCVRDLLIGREPKDWDVTTNAVPEEIIPLFEKTVYENSFGTVAVVFEVAVAVKSR